MSFSYVTVRLAQIVPTLFMMIVVIFGLVRLLPGDPTTATLGIHVMMIDAPDVVAERSSWLSMR